ncbi:unnamed protein product [Heterobilharzia americana]|nr:unnamed protein product [Heterobilharzia americana]
MVDISNILLSQFPDPQHPYISKSIAYSWKACQIWDLSYLSNEINNPIKFRLGKKQCTHIQWEPSCPYVIATITEFNNWINGVDSVNNPFNAYPKEIWWAYADYIHMSQCSEFKKLIKDLSFEELFPFLINNINPTFWLGSSKAHTIVIVIPMVLT